MTFARSLFGEMLDFLDLYDLWVLYNGYVLYARVLFDIMLEKNLIFRNEMISEYWIRTKIRN